MKEYFGEDGSGELHKTAAAFGRFGTGRLALFDTYGVPNGTNILSFAELAILLIDAGVKPKTWSRLLPIFGRSAELFAVTFHKCGAPRTLCSYRPEHNTAGYRAPSTAYVHDVALIWSKGNAHERFTKLVNSILYDDLTGAYTDVKTRQPIRLVDVGCPLRV